MAGARTVEFTQLLDCFTASKEKYRGSRSANELSKSTAHAHYTASF